MSYPRYILVFLAVAIGAGLAVAALEGRISTLGSAAQLVVPAMIAALIEGQQFAKARGVAPDRPQIWNFAWIATGVATVLNLVLSYAAGGFLPEFGKLAIASFGSQQFLILLGIYAGAYLICNRFFLSIGVSTELSRSSLNEK